MWTHVVRQHTSGGCEAPHRLHTTLMSTYKAFVWAVVAVVAVYVTGFAALTSMYMAQCAAVQPFANRNVYQFGEPSAAVQ